MLAQFFVSLFTEYTDWRVPGDSESVGLDDDNLSVLPAPSYLASMPPVVRVIYLLVCFLRDPAKSAQKNSDYPDPLPDEKAEIPSERSNLDNKISTSSSPRKEGQNGRVSRDPIVLQCIMECLVYLCHVGDCLQQLLNKTQKSLAGPNTNAVTSTGNPVTGSITGAGNAIAAMTAPTTVTTTTTAAMSGASAQSGAGSGAPTKANLVSKTSSTGAQNPGGVICGSCTATPQAQNHFVHYLVHCHLIPRSVVLQLSFF